MANSSANKRLIFAAAAGDLGAMRSALSDGADELTDALIAACEHGQTLAASYLLDQGAEKHGAQTRALHAALSKGRAETARMLLERGVPLATGFGRPDHPQAAPNSLVAATQSGDAETVRLVLEYRPNLQTDGPEALGQAVERGQPEMVRLLAGAGLSVNSNEVQSIRRWPFTYMWRPARQDATLTVLREFGYRPAWREGLFRRTWPAWLAVYLAFMAALFLGLLLPMAAVALALFGGVMGLEGVFRGVEWLAERLSGSLVWGRRIANVIFLGLIAPALLYWGVPWLLAMAGKYRLACGLTLSFVGIGWLVVRLASWMDQANARE
jgi:hypothetical protein